MCILRAYTKGVWKAYRNILEITCRYPGMRRRRDPFAKILSLIILGSVSSYCIPDVGSPLRLIPGYRQVISRIFLYALHTHFVYAWRILVHLWCKLSKRVIEESSRKAQGYTRSSLSRRVTLTYFHVSSSLIYFICLQAFYNSGNNGPWKTICTFFRAVTILF